MFSNVERYLKSNGMILTVIHTTHKCHALEIIKQMPAEEFRSYWAFVAVAGDGVPHEIVNGFYQRPDRQSLG